MRAASPDMRLDTVPGQGHPVQLRGAVNERVADWLAALAE
jgi:hypothetical protein